MNILFEFCENWERCDNEDLRSLFEEKMIKGKDFEYPSKEKVEGLNKICKECDHSLHITKQLCPVCGSSELEPGTWSGDLGWIRIYNYKCINCERNLYSPFRFT